MPLEQNLWDQVLERLKSELDSEEFRRWFASTAYASDSGDQITVWTPSESSRRHVVTHYADAIQRALEAFGRSATLVRFVVSGFDDEEEGDE